MSVWNFILKKDKEYYSTFNILLQKIYQMNILVRVLQKGCPHILKHFLTPSFLLSANRPIWLDHLPIHILTKLLWLLSKIAKFWS